jgi:streptogramin lyase
MHRSLILSVLLFPALATAQDKVSTFAGTGKVGMADGVATKALLDQPFHVDRGPRGHYYIVEMGNHAVRRVNLKTGWLDTVVGTGKKGHTGDGGKASEATLNDPHSVIVDADENLYIADAGNGVVRKVDGKTGVISLFAGGGTQGDGGPATKARLRSPMDVCLDGKGGLLIADVGDWKVRRVDLKTGTISTFAGTGRPMGKVDRAKNGDGGKASEALIIGARAVCADAQGNVYICEREGHSIRKVNAKTGIISTVVGTGKKGYAGDGGKGTDALVDGPKALRCDADGHLFIVDTENHAIRKLDVKTGIISTVLGGKKGNGPTELSRPHGVYIEPNGTLLIADSDNHRVQQLTK